MRTFHWYPAATAVLLVSLAVLASRNFDWNMTSLLHMDRQFGMKYRVPSGIVLYEDGGYDGMLYYQIARSIPHIFSPLSADSIDDFPLYDVSYRYQRILLPLLAFILSGGRDGLLPFSILCINIASVCGALYLLLRTTRAFSIHALTIVGNPASLVGILFSLTEPLSLLFVTLFLSLWNVSKKVRVFPIIFLALALLARETTAFLIVPIVMYLLLDRRIRDAAWISASLIPFFLWQTYLTIRFHELPLGTGTGMFNFPLSGIFHLAKESLTSPSVYTFSAMAFLLLFVIPLVTELWRFTAKSQKRGMHYGALAFLVTVLLFLDAHIWGVVTSVGRVIVPIYPVYAFFAFEHDSWRLRIISSMLIIVSIATAMGIAMTPHPFIIS